MVIRISSVLQGHPHYCIDCCKIFMFYFHFLLILKQTSAYLRGKKESYFFVLKSLLKMKVVLFPPANVLSQRMWFFFSRRHCYSDNFICMCRIFISSRFHFTYSYFHPAQELAGSSAIEIYCCLPPRVTNALAFSQGQLEVLCLIC